MSEPWTREDRQFNYTAPGYLGRKRPEMLHNHLLQRSLIGKAKKPTINLCPDNVYGDTYRNPFTVAHALSGWRGGALLPPKEEIVYPRPRIANDFLQYNMAGITKGITRADEMYAYRKTRKPMPRIECGPPCLKITRPPTVQLKPETIYGIKSNRPEESLTGLIEHVYLKQYLRYAKIQPYLPAADKPDYTKVKPNLTVKLRAVDICNKTCTVPTQRRKLPKLLSNVKPHLSTFCSEEVRQQAWEKHERQLLDGREISSCGIVRLPHYLSLPKIKEI